MHLTPREQELLLSYAAEPARRRRALGLRLDLSEAVAVVADRALHRVTAAPATLIAPEQETA